uniref:Uncharacterized protein n=1 Tax=Pseudomonas phage RVTF4 TaxID=3236931 RepID=A0AB39CCE5_9VIRU
MSIYIINPKERAHGTMLPADILLILRMQFHQLEAVGLYMESDVRFTNRANLYMVHEGSPDCISIKRFSNGRQNDPFLVKFHCETGRIEYNLNLLREDFPGRGDGQIWMSVLELLARVEQSFLNNDAWMFQTQISRRTRIQLRNFLRLCMTITDSSNNPVPVPSRDPARPKVLRKEGDAVAIYDRNGTLVIRLTDDSFELGPDFSAITDFDKVLDNIVVNIRPDLLKFRQNIAEKLKPLDNMLKYLEKQWKLFAVHAKTSANAADPDLVAPKIPEFMINTERYTVRRTDEHWVVTFPCGVGIQNEGHIYYELPKGKLRVMPKALDDLKALGFDLKGLFANQNRIEMAAQEHVISNYMTALAKSEREKLGLDEPTYDRYMQAFMLARENGYKRTFGDFANTLKQIL